MTPDQFRRIALSFSGAVEGAHGGHPDFRVGGKVFASLGAPGPGFGMVRLTPDQQAMLIDVNENSIRTADWGRWAILTERAVIEEVHGGMDVSDGVVQILCFPNGSTSGVEVVLAGRRDRRLHRLKVAFDALIGSVHVVDLSS